MNSKPAFDRILIVVFCVALCLPVLSWVGGISSQVSKHENRISSSFPTWQWNKSAIKTFPAEFSDWFNDHMGFRKTLVTVFARLNNDFLNSHKAVVKGKQDWFFLIRVPSTDYSRPPVVGDYCGRIPFSVSQLESWVSALVANWKRLQNAGKHYVLMIVPNKQTVYAEHFPSRINCRPGTTRLDQLVSALSEFSGFPFVDLRDRYAEVRSKPLWLHADTHWNGFGASEGYRKLLETINRKGDFQLKHPLDGAGFRLSPISVRDGDLSRMVGVDKSTVFSEPQIVVKDSSTVPRSASFPSHMVNPARVPEAFVHTNQALPSVVVFHDSFFNKRVKKMVAENFSNSTFVWHRGKPDLTIENNVIDQLNPDVIVHEMVERNLLHPYFD
jgi:alginate O-acetyltransferase complex protein AlgJ